MNKALSDGDQVNYRERAVLYRMVMEEHLCPYGLKAKDLLERHGYLVDDRWLEFREETENFKNEQHVESTPQVFINGQRIGGYDALREHLGLRTGDESDTSYQPVIAIFGVAAVRATALSWAAFDTLFTWRTGERFIAVSMCLGARAASKLTDDNADATVHTPSNAH